MDADGRQSFSVHASTLSATSPWQSGTFRLDGSGLAISFVVLDLDSVGSWWRKCWWQKIKLNIYTNLNIYSWAHEICSEDNEERSLVIGSMNEFAYVFQAWLPLLVWQQVDAPNYQKGFITVSCLSLTLIITTFVVRHLDQKERKEKKEKQ